jgi:anti-sigma regulatory factor (Ser/Thr protein kinase)
MCHVAGCGLERHPSAVSVGRHFVSSRLAAWGVGPGDSAEAALGDVLLATSELVSNAVKFGGTEVTLTVHAHRDEITIEVTDENPTEVAVRCAAPYDESGRGLALVEAVCQRWGQARRGKGKTVWCSFSLPAGSALGVDCRR